MQKITRKFGNNLRDNEALSIIEQVRQYALVSQSVVELDCSQVEYVSYAALSELADISIAAKTNGARLRVVNPSACFIAMANLTRLDTLDDREYSFDEQSTSHVNRLREIQHTTLKPSDHSPTAGRLRISSVRNFMRAIRARVVLFFWHNDHYLSALFKRIVDISISLCVLLFGAPLWLAVVLAIKIESRGPVLFKQIRVGQKGRPFPMYKFRSMYIDAENRKQELETNNEMEGGVLFKMKDDPRVTKVGRLIRRTSIDEIPQVINVIKGDMSIVGPRPALPDEVALYSINDRNRLSVNPGLTCLWQIAGRSNLSFEQQVQLDLQYMQQQSVGTDLGIIVRTVPAVVKGDGAY